MKLTLDKTKRFDVPDDPDGAYITVRGLTLEEIAECESSSTELKVDGDQNASMVLDGYKRVNNIAKKCLIGWGGFFEANGKELTHSRKNQKEVARFAFDIDGVPTRFFEWVEKCHAELQDEIYGQQEVAEKN